jgi:hypothetical protein
MRFPAGAAVPSNRQDDFRGVADGEKIAQTVEKESCEARAAGIVII